MTELLLLAIFALAAFAALELQARRFQQERREWRLERQVLLQRIQAPERAVIAHDKPDGDDTPAVSMFDDQAYWQAKGYE